MDPVALNKRLLQQHRDTIKKRIMSKRAKKKKISNQNSYALVTPHNETLIEEPQNIDESLEHVASYQ